MKKLLLTLSLSVFMISFGQSQVHEHLFGKGIQLYGKDSSYHMKFGLRFQNLFTNEWASTDDGLSDHESAFLVRRARLKFNGYAYTPKLKYKVEIGLTNRDVSGGISGEYRTAPRIILDAFIDYNFYQNFTIRVGQSKLPGNRERIVSSSSLQFVDRSRLNSRFNIDRDAGIHLLHNFTIGENFLVREQVAITQGEGRNITAGHFGGYGYTFRGEILPLGAFQSKGEYVGGAIKKESKPKLAIGFSFDHNTNAVKERGQNGSFIQDAEGNYYGKNLSSYFIDMMFKYQGLSVMAEYVNKWAEDDDPNVYTDADELVGTYFTGTGLNLQAGYMLAGNWEMAARYTMLSPQEGVSNEETEYAFALSKYVVGHKLKVQTDVGFRSVTDRDNLLFWRMQMEVHF